MAEEDKSVVEHPELFLHDSDENRLYVLLSEIEADKRVGRIYGRNIFETGTPYDPKPPLSVLEEGIQSGQTRVVVLSNTNKLSIIGPIWYLMNNVCPTTREKELAPPAIHLLYGIDDNISQISFRKGKAPVFQRVYSPLVEKIQSHFSPSGNA
jgi:hypothetical protein